MSMTEQPTHSPPPRSQQHLKIRQQNLNKSLTAQSEMLQQLVPHEYDIATIQEPYLDFNHNSCTSHNWYTLYPKEHYAKPNKTRLLLLINKSMPTNKWSQVNFASSNMMAIQIQTPVSPLLLINLYNNLRTSEGAWKVIKYMRNKPMTAAHAPQPI